MPLTTTSQSRAYRANVSAIEPTANGRGERIADTARAGDWGGAA